MDKNLRLSSSGKLLTRRLSCRICQSLFCTNGTALRWLCTVSPAGPSLRWSRESLLVAAPYRLLLPVTISTPSELLPGPASQTAPQNPDPELRAPPTGPHCSLPFSLPCWKMPEKPEGPFLLARGEREKSQAAPSPCQLPVRSLGFRGASARPNSHSAAQDSAQCPAPK